MRTRDRPQRVFELKETKWEIKKYIENTQERIKNKKEGKATNCSNTIETNLFLHNSKRVLLLFKFIHSLNIPQAIG